MTELLITLRKLETIKDFACKLGYYDSFLSYLLYKLPDDKKYKEFLIDKKSGGARTITAPCTQIKKLQKKLAKILNNCTQEIKKNIKNKPAALGIHTNAKCHKNKKYVLNLDLADFFPSFNFGRVRGYFIKNKYFLLQVKIATVIAQIACDENKLPQGSPCSPVISNLITNILDNRLNTWAKKK